jgi:hypothetical protein
MFVDDSEVCLNERRPLLLYTQALLATPGTACSKAHNQHPFVALVLKHADVASTVYISMPYFTDMHVLDELCHYAQDEEKGGRSLVINIILSETKENKAKINKFIGGNAGVQKAVERLGLPRFTQATLFLRFFREFCGKQIKAYTRYSNQL